MEGWSALFLMACHILGKGGLDGAGTEGKTDAEDRMYHIVKAQAFGSYGAGEENPIEESQYSAEKSGSRKQQSSGQKSTLLRGEGNGWHRGSGKDEN